MEGKKVFKYHAGIEEVLFDFALNLGDTLVYDNYTLAVDTIVITNKLSAFSLKDSVILFQLSNKGFLNDSLISLSYATRFGLLSFWATYGHEWEGFYMEGAKIEGIMHGSLLNKYK
jgi:hypothetical protein